VGLDAAAPLLFEILVGLPRTEPLWQRHVPEVALREICAGSGQPRGPCCPHGREGKYVPGVSPAATCGVHREILIDTSTGWAVCSRCLVKGRYRREIVERWPPAVAQHLRTKMLPDQVLPPHDPSCRALEPGSAPIIASPREDAVYAVRPGVPIEDQKIALAAAVARGTSEVFWFLDETLVGKGPPDRTVFVTPGAGDHRICVKDDRGRSASVLLRVESER
jgi:penicillin-binding protein 1C